MPPPLLTDTGDLADDLDRTDDLEDPIAARDRLDPRTSPASAEERLTALMVPSSPEKRNLLQMVREPKSVKNRERISKALHVKVHPNVRNNYGRFESSSLLLRAHLLCRRVI